MLSFELVFILREGGAGRCILIPTILFFDLMKTQLPSSALLYNNNHCPSVRQTKEEPEFLGRCSKKMAGFFSEKKPPQKKNTSLV